MSAIRILVADSVTVFRAAVCTLIGAEPDFTVTEAANAAEVEAVAARHPVDLALLDLDLPPGGALEAVRTLRSGGTEVVVWSFEPNHQDVFAAIRAGACGYLNKDISSDGLVRSLRGAANGEAPLSRELMALMIEALHDVESRRGAEGKAASLSTREREVLAQLAAGARNSEIASALSISLFTVKRHVQNILHKLDVGSRAEAATLYRLLATPQTPEQVSA